MFIEKRIEGRYGRDYIEQISNEERWHSRYKMDKTGISTLAQDNAYGEIVFVQEDGTELPVICGHGGSMWLCRKCKNETLKAQILRIKNET